MPTVDFDKFRAPAAEVAHLANNAQQEAAYLKRNDEMWQRVKRAASQLKLVSEAWPDLSPEHDVALVLVARNEGFRLPYFFDYYRKLGVTRFLYVDNDSTDGSLDYVRSQPDCVAWWTDASYAEAKSGLGWYNYILNTCCHGIWTLVIDPDEFLVYDGIASHGLRDLTEYLRRNDDVSLFTTLVDMYSDTAVERSKYISGQDPLEVCPFFDGDGYSEKPVPYNGLTQISGGPRARFFSSQFEKSPPALNKIPLLLFSRGTVFLSSTHMASPAFYNKSKARGVLMHFKFFSSFSERVSEEVARGEHYNGAIEYKLYQEKLESGEETILYYEGSRRFRSEQDFLDIGLITPIDFTQTQSTKIEE